MGILCAVPGDIYALILRLVLASICGLAIGFERTKRLKEAGIRTHCIIAGAAALAMMISKYGFADMVTESGLYAGTDGADPARLAAGIITGVSFLGAGVIFRNGNSVKGLTTAAGIWATAVVGLAIGAGMILLGVAGAAMIVTVQVLFHRYSIGNDAFSETDVHVIAEDSERIRDLINTLIDEKKVQLLTMRMVKQPDGIVLFNVSFRTRRDFSVNEAVSYFGRYHEIRSINY